MKIAVTGATGQLGRLVVNKLREQISSSDIVALVRSVEKASDLGVEAREADYDQPETLQRSLIGIDTLLLISGSEVGKRAVQHKTVIEAAKKNEVKWIVYTSLLHADRSSINLAAEHLATEDALMRSGIAFTLLRNGWYTENYTGSLPGAIANGAIIGSAGEGKISSAARVDFADAAVAVLTSSGHDGKVYELAGDEAWTLSDLAEEVSRQTGKNIRYVDMPETEYAKVLAGFGLPEGLSQAIASWDVAASKGDLFDDSHQLSRIIGRPTTPLSITVGEALKEV
jgi:NAD(P)H dehydrogenase (quinone)